jgi:hypothetical protein
MHAQQFIEREAEVSQQQNRPVAGVTQPDQRGRPDRHGTAALSDAQITTMDRDELIELVRASEHPWDDSEMAQHLEFSDRCSLLRLAFLARRYCQNAELAAHDLVVMDELDGSQYQRNVGTMFGQPR